MLNVLLPKLERSREEFKWQPRHKEVGRAIGPHQSDQYLVSLQFEPSECHPERAACDRFKRFATSFPAKLNWRDRRPIGELVLASHGRDSPFVAGNPRFWRIIKAPVDVNSENGRREFEKKAF